MVLLYISIFRLSDLLKSGFLVWETQQYGILALTQIAKGEYPALTETTT